MRAKQTRQDITSLIKRFDTETNPSLSSIDHNCEKSIKNGPLTKLPGKTTTTTTTPISREQFTQKYPLCDASEQKPIDIEQNRKSPTKDELKSVKQPPYPGNVRSLPIANNSKLSSPKHTYPGKYGNTTSNITNNGLSLTENGRQEVLNEQNIPKSKNPATHTVQTIKLQNSNNFSSDNNDADHVNGDNQTIDDVNSIQATRLIKSNTNDIKNETLSQCEEKQISSRVSTNTVPTQGDKFLRTTVLKSRRVHLHIDNDKMLSNANDKTVSFGNNISKDIPNTTTTAPKSASTVTNTTSTTNNQNTDILIKKDNANVRYNLSADNGYTTLAPKSTSGMHHITSTRHTNTLSKPRSRVGSELSLSNDSLKFRNGSQDSIYSATSDDNPYSLFLNRPNKEPSKYKYNPRNLREGEEHKEKRSHRDSVISNNSRSSEPSTYTNTFASNKITDVNSNPNSHRILKRTNRDLKEANKPTSSHSIKHPSKVRDIVDVPNNRNFRNLKGIDCANTINDQRRKYNNSSVPSNRSTVQVKKHEDPLISAHSANTNESPLETKTDSIEQPTTRDSHSCDEAIIDKNETHPSSGIQSKSQQSTEAHSKVEHKLKHINNNDSAVSKLAQTKSSICFNNGIKPSSSVANTKEPSLHQQCSSSLQFKQSNYTIKDSTIMNKRTKLTFNFVSSQGPHSTKLKQPNTEGLLSHNKINDATGQINHPYNSKAKIASNNITNKRRISTSSATNEQRPLSATPSQKSNDSNESLLSEHYPVSTNDAESVYPLSQSAKETTSVGNVIQVKTSMNNIRKRTPSPKNSVDKNPRNPSASHSIAADSNVHQDGKLHPIPEQSPCNPLEGILPTENIPKDLLKKWIHDLILTRDSLIAAHLISNKIYERASNAVEEQDTLEKKTFLNHVIQKDHKISCILEENQKLKSELENIKCNLPQFQSNSQLISSTNSSINNNANCDLLRAKSCPMRKQQCVIDAFSNQNNQTVNLNVPSAKIAVCSPTEFTPLNFDTIFVDPITDYRYPTPPPDLPELTNRIPDPPPDIPTPDMYSISPAESRSYVHNLQLAKKKKTKVLKPLHWKRLKFHNRKHKHELIWKTLPKFTLPCEISEFEELFENQNTHHKMRRDDCFEFSFAKKAHEVLDFKLANPIGIILKKLDSLSIYFEDIETVLLNADLKATNIDLYILENLKKLIIKENIDKIKAFTLKNIDVEISREDKFLLRLSNIGHVHLRMKHIIFIYKFDEYINDIERNINILTACCYKLRDSNELKTLLASILHLGNYMNQSYDYIKDAHGFDLDHLPKLKETKTNDNSSTFLQFIARCYLLDYESSITHGSINNILPFPDTGDLLVASNLRLSEEQKSLSKLSEQLTRVRENTKTFICATSANTTTASTNPDPDLNCNDKFLNQVELFFVSAEKHLTEVSDSWTLCFRVYRELLYYFFGEFKDDKDPKNKETDVFFKIWSDFSQDFKEALKKEHENIVIQRRRIYSIRQTKIAPIVKNSLKDRISKHLSHTKPITPHHAAKD